MVLHAAELPGAFSKARASALRLPLPVLIACANADASADMHPGPAASADFSVTFAALPAVCAASDCKVARIRLSTSAILLELTVMSTPPTTPSEKDAPLCTTLCTLV